MVFLILEFVLGQIILFLLVIGYKPLVKAKGILFTTFLRNLFLSVSCCAILLIVLTLCSRVDLFFHLSIAVLGACLGTVFLMHGYKD
ncbi:hypothetical protein B14_04122 [Bacillus licheniformis]|nr:hypothetical protein B14_04122 [Bacillus licheniformis]